MKRTFLLIAVLFGWFLPTAGDACTIFKVENAGHVLVGHSFDWRQEAGMLVANKRNMKKTALVGSFTHHTPARWTSRYGSITVSWISQELPTAGINEKGLLVAGLLLRATRYAKKKGDKPIISSSQWKQYLLDTCSSVKQALEAMKKVQIVKTSRFGQHYFLADAHGDAAVLQFIEGAPRIYHGEGLPIAALTNNRYNIGVAHARAGGEPGPISRIFDLSSDSETRFARAARAVAEFPQVSTNDSTGYILASLEKVRRPGTQWQLVYDLNKPRISIRTASVSQLRTIGFGEVDLNCGPAEYLPILDASTTRFQPLNETVRRQYLKRANRIIRLPTKKYKVLENYPETLSCAE